jgi:hypothetical protein
MTGTATAVLALRPTRSPGPSDSSNGFLINDGPSDPNLTPEEASLWKYQQIIICSEIYKIVFRAIVMGILASGGVCRACGGARPSNCPANVTALQSALPQKNRRTPSHSATGCPPTGESASRRRYLLCARSENWPHRRPQLSGSLQIARHGAKAHRGSKADQSSVTAAVQDCCGEPSGAPVNGSKYSLISPMAIWLSESRRICSARSV